MITMQEIGRLADVSQSTVSLILNGQSRKARISANTRSRVLKIAQEHGFAPNLLARAMKTGNTGIIGILFSKEAMQQIADNHGNQESTLQLQVGFLLRGKQVMLEAISDEDCNNLKMPYLLRSGLVDTIILSQNFKQENTTYHYIEKMRHFARCIIILDDIINDIVPSVTIDDENAGRTAAEYLWSLGHRSFGAISCAEQRVALSRRLDAFKKRISELSNGTIPVVKSFGGDRWQINCGEIAMSMLLEKTGQCPSAIFATNDFFAYGAEQELIRRNIRIPEEVSLLGIGEWPMAATAPVPITTISVNTQQKIDAVINIWQQFLNKEELTNKEVRIVGTLCSRASTAQKMS